MAQVEGVEFVLAAHGIEERRVESRGVENPDHMAAWTHQNLERFRALGEKLQAGVLEYVAGLGPQRNVAFAFRDDAEFCIGWDRELKPEQIYDRMKKVLALWVC